MKHLTEEELILLYYGEPGGRPGAEEHVEHCSDCYERMLALQRLLNSVPAPEVPDPGPDFESRVWQRLEPALEEVKRPWWRRLPRAVWLDLPPKRVLAASAAAICLAVVAFFAGRTVPGTQPAREAATSESPVVLERVLVLAVGDHLERSQRMLAELVNSSEEDLPDLTYERARARELVQANRLFRQTAAREGNTGVASVLDDLERVLVEIAHAPEDISPQQLRELRRRIERQGILFQVRIVGDRLRKQQAAQPEAEETL
ncbi:MAG: hypothetical protein IRZ15_06575 [Bryobacteraceae bacterium]|nr:hypothetical protein [Bryobacteraceae bacterium]